MHTTRPPAAAGVPTRTAARPALPPATPPGRSGRCDTRNVATAAVVQVSGPGAEAGDDGASTAAAGGGELVLYTKADCPLCAGLESKIRAALDKAAFLPSPLTGVTLTTVDIATLPDGGGPLALEVPVVAWRGAGGQDVVVPRAPPRATADKVAAGLIEAKKEVVEIDIFL